MCEYVCGSDEGGAEGGQRQIYSQGTLKRDTLREVLLKNHKAGWERGEGEVDVHWEHLEKPQGRGVTELDFG